MRWFRYAAVASLLLLVGTAARMVFAPTDTTLKRDSRDAEHVLAGSGVSSLNAPDEAPPRLASRTGRRRHDATEEEHADDSERRVWRPFVYGTVAAEQDDGVFPYAGAMVRLYDDDPLGDDEEHALSTRVTKPIAEQTTGADGGFEFPARGLDAWRIVVSAPGGLGTHARGRTSENVGELLLYDLGRAEVSVSDGEDEQIKDAYAYLYAATFDVLPFGIVHAGPGGKIVLDPAPGMVLVTAPGHGFADITNPSGAEQVVLARGLDVGGQIVDETGAPMAGIRVSVDDDGPSRTTRTAEDGTFRFERIGEQDEVYLSIRVAGRDVSRVLGYGETNARIVIPSRGDIAGIAVYPDGSPAVGAMVEGEAVDDDGRFVIWTDGRDRALTIVADVTGRVPGFGAPVPTHRVQKRIELHPGQTTDVRLVLEPSPHSFAHVRAIAPDGSVALSPFVHVRGVWNRRQLNHESVLVVVGIEPGTALDISIVDHARQHLPRRIQIVTSARADVASTDVHLGAVEPVTLRVLDTDGSPVPRPEWKKVHVEPGRVLDDGRIAAAPGAYIRVVVEARGRRIDGRYQLPTKSPFELSIRLAGTSRVTGRLLRGDGSPARDVDIVVAPFSALGTGANLRARPEQDGTFVVENVPGGRALFVVWQSDGEVQAQRTIVEVPDDGELDLGQMLAWDDVVLEGRVTAPHGTSVAGLAVEVWWDEGREAAYALSRADGSFRMRVPGVPDAVLTASRRGSLFGVTGVDLSTTRRASVRVQRIGTIRVHMGDDWAATSFDTYMAAPDRSVTWGTSCEWIDRGRVIVVEDAPSGTWVLRAVRGDEVVERTVHVTPGEETVLQLER